MGKNARTLLATLACSASVLVSAAPASAQVVIMRKMMPFKPGAEPVFENPTTPKPGDPVVTNPNSYYSWVVSPWQQEGACGSQGVQTRSVSCKRTDGTVVPDSRCIGNGSGPKPIAAQPVEITRTCGYQWDPGAWIDPGASCGSEKQTRDVVCRRSDGKVADDKLCGEGKPSLEQTVTDFSACTYSWAPGAWSAPTNQCGASTQTREVTCVRSNGDKMPDAACSAAGAKPALEQQAYVISGCKANWVPGAWGASVPACGTSSQTRTVTCLRADGVTVSDDQCILEKPATKQAVKDYSTCVDGRTPENPFGWTVGQYGPLSTTCGQAVQTRSVLCTDDDGKTVPDSNCKLAKPVGELKSLQTSSCTYQWQTGDYGPFQPACGKTARNRTVTCTRSDGSAVGDSFCSAAGTKPVSTDPYTDYSACTFGWAVGAWGTWSSTCGTGTQSRTVSCQRSDGTPATEDNCKLEKPATTQTGYQTTGCTFAWQARPWVSPQACGDVTQTRDVQCVRSDGVAIDDATCAAVFAKPVTTQKGKDYTTCSYRWAVGSYGAWSTTCGKATSSRSVTCQRSDGTTVTDTFCAETKPDTQQSSDQLSGCTYTWKTADWMSPTPACGASVQSRTVTCTRSDNSVAAPSSCTATMPATQQATTDYSTCGYTWEVSAWDSSNLCGQSAIQTRTVSCRRSDGNLTKESDCITYGAGPKPAASQTVSSYTGCGYTWRTSYGAWSSTCSDSATRINSVTCQRSDGVVVDDSMCAGDAPSRQDTQGVYSSCTYTPTYSTTYGECKPTTQNSSVGIQTAPVATCTRSDGKVVDNALCLPQLKSQSCTVGTGGTLVREPYYIDDPYRVTATQKLMNNSSSSELRLVVLNTRCFDASKNAIVADSQCSSLPQGANVYDVGSIPATYTPDSREIWVNRSDVVAFAPRGYFMSYYSGAASFCSAGIDMVVQAGAQAQTWIVRCGTPDRAGRYTRVADMMDDPINVLPSSVDRFKNTSPYASTYNFAVGSTKCVDTTTKVNAPLAKCQYLPTGVNAYDLVSVPAVYSKELREITIATADLQAAIPYGAGTRYGYDVLSSCRNGGLYGYVGTSAGVQTWIVRCGTPDQADHYARSPANISDPARLNVPGQFTNTDSTSGALRLMVTSTMCVDTNTGSSIAASKCQYLSTGTNVYDLVSMPATFVKDLREVYVQGADLRNALGYGYTVNDNNSYSAMCSSGYATAVTIFPNGRAGSGAGSESWNLRCGPADSASNYVRMASNFDDPAYQSQPNANPGPSATTLKFVITRTQCRTSAGAGADARKCQYLPTGGNVSDLISVPATFVKDLREVYIDSAKLQAQLDPGAQYSSVYYSINQMCIYGPNISIGGIGYSIRCGTTPDSADHYARFGIVYDDPNNFYASSDAPTRYVNDTGKNSLSFVVQTTRCYDTTAKTIVDNKKCAYLPSGSNQYDIKSIPATWDVQAKTVTISTKDYVAMSLPYPNLAPASSYGPYGYGVCEGSIYVPYGASGRYTIKCK